MMLTINSQKSFVLGLDELHEQFAAVRKMKFAEIWLNSDEGEALCILTNRDRGWLMFLRNEGDSGFSSRNPNYLGSKESVLEFEMSNGQTDKYPAHWTFPLDEVFCAAEVFFEKRERVLWINWHDDSKRDE